MPDPFDPFTASYQAIASALSAWSPLMALVGVGNFVDLTGAGFEQLRFDAQTSDTPSLSITQGKFQLAPSGGVSNVVEFSQEYQVAVLTDTLRLPPINLVKYHILRALLAAGPTLGSSLIQQIQFTGGQDQIEPLTKQNQTRRWQCALTIQVSMYLPRATLVNPAAA